MTLARVGSINVSKLSREKVNLAKKKMMSAMSILFLIVRLQKSSLELTLSSTITPVWRWTLLLSLHLKRSSVLTHPKKYQIVPVTLAVR